MELELIKNLLFITFIIVYIIDFSGIIVDISRMIYVLLNPGKEYSYQIIKKPFNCSLCMTFWIVFLYTLILGTPIILSLLYGTIFGGFITIIIKKIITLFYKIIN